MDYPGCGKDLYGESEMIYWQTNGENSVVRWSGLYQPQSFYDLKRVCGQDYTRYCVDCARRYGMLW
jgi:hypothetical protein